MRTFPVIEIFGPVVQGEGVMAGHQTHFLRLGGCDYRCSWCDTKYAVTPSEVKKNSIPMNAFEIESRLDELAAHTKLKTVTLSGGNPAMFDLEPLVVNLKAGDWKVVVETQGSIWQNWFRDLDLVTISPKPPSSGMVCDDATLKSICTKLKDNWSEVCMKIVAFDHNDLVWAKELFHFYNEWPRFTFYLQPGTNLAHTHIEGVRNELLNRTQVLQEELLQDPTMRHVRVMPQIHSLIYGDVRGV